MGSVLYRPNCRGVAPERIVMSQLRPGWISSVIFEQLKKDRTTAHRLFSSPDLWIERFGDDLLISSKSAPHSILPELEEWSNANQWKARRIFSKILSKQPTESDKPVLLVGDSSLSKAGQAQEWGLFYGIDFEAGYSPGLFMDQRMNRQHVLQNRPKRVLNCFAYTCAFSVAAASIGAQTISVDLSRRSLDRGKTNFELNQISTEGHRFIADDVFGVLGYLQRKGERFDCIILDPPTFSRGSKLKTFRIEENFEDMVRPALGVLQENGEILLSTNCSRLTTTDLKRRAMGCLRAGEKSRFSETEQLPDIAAWHMPSTVWMKVGKK